MLACVLGGLAAYNGGRARRALHARPFGRVIETAGVRLHLMEKGSGMPLVLLHGNGSSAEDFELSGIFDEAAKRYRVLAFDRPGFGRSTRPGGGWWTPAVQADLIHTAVTKLGISRYLLLGHSWGASVAVQGGLRYPGSVAGVVLVSGYYYPSPRVDLALAALPALPVAGSIFRQTLMPLLVRFGWPLAMAQIFYPAAVPPAFASAMKEVASRPSQLRTVSAESGLLLAAALIDVGYNELSVPTGIMAGAGDRVLNAEEQARRLHAEVPHAVVDVVPDVGHMVHHSAPEGVLAMIDRIAAESGAAPSITGAAGRTRQVVAAMPSAT